MNKAIISGRLVADPELKHTASNIAVCSFRIAVDRSHSPKDKKQADFFDVIAWRHSAEFVCNYFKKGKFIVIEGHFETRSYDDKQGVRRKVVELIAEHIEFGGDTANRQTDAGLPEPPPEYKAGQAPGDFAEIDVEHPEDLPF